MVTQALTVEQVVCLESTRSYKQYYNMRRDFEEGRCTFCQLNRSLNSVEWEDEHVFAWHAPRAYMRSGLSYYALFVPKRHVRFEAELTDAEVLSLHQAKKELHEHYGYRGGCTHVREGDMSLNGGSVPHLHYNAMMADGTEGIDITIFKSPWLQAEHQQRAAGFALRYESGETP